MRKKGKREEEGMGEDGNKNNKQGDGIGEGGENEKERKREDGLERKIKKKV